jgi:tRNA-dihydrouridine synthase
MEGVTEPCFRDLVLEENAPTALGGAFTEFVRVVDHPLPTRTLRARLGPRRYTQPVGVQLMGSNVDALAATARNAELAGAPLVDLNFGCPAKGALRGCAGSALLREPARVEALVRACAGALETIPLTAKIRAGYDDDSLLEDLARAAEAGGASLLTVHCRTRREAYQDAVDWTRIARAVAAVRIPVCGNGGVLVHADLERMRRETGAAFAMVGRGALADPWIFSGRGANDVEASQFLLEYAARLQRESGTSLAGAAQRVKQLLRYWTAGELCGFEREAWLRDGADALFARLANRGSSVAAVRADP